VGVTEVEGMTSLSRVERRQKSDSSQEQQVGGADAIKPTAQSNAACKVPTRVTYQSLH
jgi:hypothetical protein